MKYEFEAKIVKDSYSGWNGWVEDLTVEINEYTTLDDILKKFEGKKVKICIEKID